MPNRDRSSQAQLNEASSWGQGQQAPLGAPSTYTPLPPTCELWAESLWVVDDIFPELLKLRYPSNILQEPHQISAYHETIHELGEGKRRERERKNAVIVCLFLGSVT